MELAIKGFTEQDVGSYKCISTNGLGRADGTLRLYGMLDKRIETSKNLSSNDPERIRKTLSNERRYIFIKSR